MRTCCEQANMLTIWFNVSIYTFRSSQHVNMTSKTLALSYMHGLFNNVFSFFKRGWSSLVWSADFKSVGDETCSVVRFHLLRVMFDFIFFLLSSFNQYFFLKGYYTWLFFLFCFWKKNTKLEKILICLHNQNIHDKKFEEKQNKMPKKEMRQYHDVIIVLSTIMLILFK